MRLKSYARRTRRREDIVAASKAAIRLGKHLRSSKSAAEKASGPYAPVVDELRAVHQQLRLANQLVCREVCCHPRTA